MILRGGSSSDVAAGWGISSAEISDAKNTLMYQERNIHILSMLVSLMDGDMGAASQLNGPEVHRVADNQSKLR
jgi:hypothetical protein